MNFIRILQNTQCFIFVFQGKEMLHVTRSMILQTILQKIVSFDRVPTTANKG